MSKGIITVTICYICKARANQDSDGVLPDDWAYLTTTKKGWPVKTQYICPECVKEKKL